MQALLDTGPLQAWLLLWQAIQIHSQGLLATLPARLPRRTPVILHPTLIPSQVRLGTLARPKHRPLHGAPHPWRYYRLWGPLRCAFLQLSYILIISCLKREPFFFKQANVTAMQGKLKQFNEALKQEIVSMLPFPSEYTRTALCSVDGHTRYFPRGAPSN